MYCSAHVLPARGIVAEPLPVFSYKGRAAGTDEDSAVLYRINLMEEKSHKHCACGTLFVSRKIADCEINRLCGTALQRNPSECPGYTAQNCSDVFQLLRTGNFDIRHHHIKGAESGIWAVKGKSADIADAVQTENTHFIMGGGPSLQRQHIVHLKDRLVPVQLNLETKIDTRDQVLLLDSENLVLVRPDEAAVQFSGSGLITGERHQLFPEASVIFFPDNGLNEMLS